MREMKDSGIEWIGNIPATWERCKIKNVISSIGSGTTPTSSNIDYYNSEDIRWIQSGDLYKTSYISNTAVSLSAKALHLSALQIYAAPFIVVAMYGASVGNIAISTIDACSNQACCCIKPDNNNDLKFMYYWLSMCKIDFLSQSIGGGQPNISQSKIKNQFYYRPQLSEQKVIANFLDSKCSEIDAISADIQKEIETLEQYKRSVITEAVTKGLNPDAEMKDSGVAWCPQIPSHWQYSNPKGLFGLRTDRAFRDDRQLTASQEYGIVYQDEYMEKTGNKVVTVTKDFSILKHVEPDDFVISMRSFQGGLEYSDKRGCISSAYVMLIPNKEFVYAPFYRWFFKSSKYINALQSTSNLVRDGQAMRYANFVKVPLFIVPIEEQKAIASYLDEKIEKVNSILAEKKKQLEILSNYKKSLIYEYVTGKKEVLT